MDAPRPVVADQAVRLIVVGPERIGNAVDGYQRALPACFEEAQIQLAGLNIIHGDRFDEINLADVDQEATDILILNTSLSDKSWRGLDKLRRVAKIGRLRQGIDRAALESRGIRYVQLYDPSYVAVAEHTLLLMLACAKRLGDALVDGRFDVRDQLPPMVTGQNNRRTNWRRLDGSRHRLLHESRLGIVGLGEIGYELALRARGLGMSVYYHNRKPLPNDIERAASATYLSKIDLLQECDFVVIATTVPDDGSHIVSSDDIDVMKNGSILVNISRGVAVDEAALIRATSTRDGHLGGAGLDVFTIEPTQASNFEGCDNVYLTAHSAAVLPRGRRFSGYMAFLSDTL